MTFLNKMYKITLKLEIKYCPGFKICIHVVYYIKLKKNCLFYIYGLKNV